MAKVKEAMEMELLEVEELFDEVVEEMDVQVQQPKADVSSLLKQLPQVVTTKDLCNVLGYDDGGKTLRRTLRAKFSDNHSHKTKWEWTQNDPVLLAILAHFVGSRKMAIAQ